jgi:hypothetical protein
MHHTPTTLPYIQVSVMSVENEREVYFALFQA